MSYPTYWQGIISKLQDFKGDLLRAKHKRKAVKITIELHHKSFGAENKRIVTLDLNKPEMNEIVEEIESILHKKELELEEKIKDYESRREGTDRVGGLANEE